MMGNKYRIFYRPMAYIGEQRKRRKHFVFAEYVIGECGNASNSYSNYFNTITASIVMHRGVEWIVWRRLIRILA